MQSICLLFLSTVAATYMIYWLRPVLMPLVVAFFVVSGVSPLLAALEKRLGVSRLIAAALAFMCGVFILVLFGCTILVSTLELARNSDGYRKRVRELVTEMERALPRGLLKRDGEESPLFGLVPTFEPKPDNRAAAGSDEGLSQPSGGESEKKSNLESRREAERDPLPANVGRSAKPESGRKPAADSKLNDSIQANPESMPTRDESEASPLGTADKAASKPGDSVDAGEGSDSDQSDSANSGTGEFKPGTGETNPDATGDGPERADDSGSDDAEIPNASSAGDSDSPPGESGESETGASPETKGITIASTIEVDRSRRNSAVIREVESWQNQSRAYDPAASRAEEERLAVARATQLVDAFVRDGISIISQALVSLVSTSVVVLIYVFFLLMGTPSLATTEAVQEIDQQIRSYLSLKTIISIFTGLCFGFALRMFGVPMAFTFGVLAFLLNFVPNVGPIVASLLPIPLIIFHPDGTVVWMVVSITVICSIQLISGNIVEPKIMGDSSDLHPVSILVALMFWGMMWGIIGMFLATPITSAMKIMFERFETTRPIANLMAGRWDEKDSQVVGFGESDPVVSGEGPT